MQIQEKQNYLPAQLHYKHHTSLEHSKSPETKKQTIQKPFSILKQIQHQTQFISTEDNQVYASVMEWFSLKQITRGNPEEIIQKFTAQSHQRVRQLSGNGPFLPRLNILDSKLIRKRCEKIRN